MINYLSCVLKYFSYKIEINGDSIDIVKYNKINPNMIDRITKFKETNNKNEEQLKFLKAYIRNEAVLFGGFSIMPKSDIINYLRMLLKHI